MSIAKIALAPGQLGYFDEISRIRLTAAHPTADIMVGTNTTQIKNDVKKGKLVLLYGTLASTTQHIRKSAARPVPVQPEIVEEPEPIIQDEIIESVSIEPIGLPSEIELIADSDFDQDPVIVDDDTIDDSIDENNVMDQNIVAKDKKTKRRKKK